ncbi:unnamed protein product, partial [Symbiodinium microadriaticum]
MRARPSKVGGKKNPKARVSQALGLLCSTAPFHILALTLAGLGEKGEGDDVKACANFIERVNAAVLEALPAEQLVKLAEACAKSKAVAETILPTVAKACAGAVPSWSMDDVSKLLFALAKVKTGGDLPEISELYGRAAEALNHLALKLRSKSTVDAVVTCNWSGLVHMTAFTEEEVFSAVTRLKMGKTSGISGISNELLQSMWSLPQGKAVLLAFFNKMLESPTHPSDMHDSFVTLLPKVKNAMQASEVRPVHLIETANKLYCFLLLSRLYPSWPIPSCQFGAIRGGQVMDAMAAAQWQVLTESFQGTSGIWVNADIKSAFDTVNHAALAKFVFGNCPNHLCREAMQLLQIALHPRLVFDCLGEQWTTEQKQGVQQGHTYSAIVFSYLIGNVVQSQFSDWNEAGYHSDIGDWGWLFVDDLILRFRDWATAAELLPQMQHALSLVGLRFNLRKTQLFATEDTLRQGRRIALNPDHIL